MEKGGGVKIEKNTIEEVGREATHRDLAIPNVKNADDGGMSLTDRTAATTERKSVEFGNHKNLNLS